MKWLMIGAMTASLLALAAAAVMAHKGQLPGDALTLVRQASALLAQNPTMTGEVRERLQAALKSRKPEGVRLNQVAEALRALEKKDLTAARRLLIASIMPAGMPMPPEGSRRPVPQAPVAAPSAPPVPARAPAVQPAAPPSVDMVLTMAEPLRARFTGSAAEIVILASALALIGVGLTSLWRSREAVRP